MAEPGAVAEVDEAGSNGDIGCRQRIAAEAESLFGQAKTDRIRADRRRRTRAHDAAATKPEGIHIRHAEVGRHAADHRAFAAGARETSDQHADIRGGAADIDHGRVGEPGEEGRTAHGIGRSGRDREHRITFGEFGGH
ncbi:hypothetical protein D9M72_525420 [compost metagenome]